MKKIITLILGIGFFFIAATTYAQEQTDYDKSITRVGTSVVGLSHFAIDGDFTLSCKDDVVYINANTDFGKAALETVLTAKSTGHKLSRIQYFQESDTTCNLWMVEYN